MENRDQVAAQNHACASCKHQRRKCDETCEMAPYFPASRYSEFQHAQKIFGVSNIQKIMAMAAPDQRQAAAESILTEGNARKNDPVHGCLGIIRGLNAQIQGLETELHIMKQHLELCKEKEELDGKKNQAKEDLQHDQSDGLNFPSPIVPDLPSHVMAEMRKYEQGYNYWSTLEDAEEEVFDIQLIEPVLFESKLKGNASSSGSGKSSCSAAASKAQEKQPSESLQEKTTEDEA
ncbi:PREDICTED: LOB domain-containing protein 22-like [Prunus mume]|uniref:LOB domain-containing protein 22-like n=1 Tax=Prunus mume TaxID=102107 RepID=A0ABM0PMU9_PRUMU|nr:PREDICTED: LOB domain-containing protein 22-like [Prunus mume]